MDHLQFYIRHHDNYLQEKMILVFKSDEARDCIKQSLEGCQFEVLNSEQAHHAARIGINGKIIPYGYTTFLTEEEMGQLSTAKWEQTAELLAEGNERLYEKIKNNR
ncbi:MAG TPA: hypothetical protein VK125_08315 [Bacillota bacterium]|nr:hypothetical protein [Bacillota bacterium]